MSSPNLTTPSGLRSYAELITHVWAEWSDEDLSEMAVEASEALRNLADRIENGS